MTSMTVASPCPSRPRPAPGTAPRPGLRATPRPAPRPGADYRAAPPVSPGFAPWAQVLDQAFAEGGVDWVMGEHGALVPVPRSGQPGPRGRGALPGRLSALLRRRPLG